MICSTSDYSSRIQDEGEPFSKAMEKIFRSINEYTIHVNMKWVTRERAKVDRIACPWLISRFVDKDAKFIFVPAEKVSSTAAAENAIPFDVPGVELTHYRDGGNEYVSFDAIIRKYGLTDAALLELAKIVRGADANVPGAPAESPGLEAAALGFRDLAKDDHENMRLQFPFYDAMYRYCRLRLEQNTRLEHSK